MPGSLLRKLLHHLHLYEGLILVLSLHTLLRIPNFFEPYWYGDEGIYLTIGTAMRHGARLYADIVDHKTPLIYYLAMAPTQFWFRMLLWIWMSVTIVCVYFFLKKMQFAKTALFTALIAFTAITALPALEGNIPNGELFVMGWVSVGAVLLASTAWFQSFFQPTQKVKFKDLRQQLTILIAGAFFGLAILTKVPALFDAAPFLALPFFFLLNGQRLNKRNLSQALLFFGIFFAGVVLPIVLSVVYYWLRGTLGSYLEFGLLYNFRYANSWGLPTTNPIILFFLSLPGKAVVVLLLTGIFIVLQRAKKLTFFHLFLFFWFISTFFASLLSSRPYPHYLLQMALPVAILIGSLTQWKTRLLSEKVVSIAMTGLLVVVLLFFNFRMYPTVSYYTRFFSMLSGSLPQDEYENSFDRLVKDNREVTAILRNSADDNLFIWGTNPMLYAQAQKVPTSRFTVSFHIKDIPGSDTETFQKIQTTMPYYIVVMRNERDRLTGLADLLASEYIPAKSYDSMILYKKR